MTKTTFEMDGLLTEEDIERRFNAFLQCRGCAKWTKVHRDYSAMPKELYTCLNCGDHSFDLTSFTSERTFNPSNKRKVKR